MRAAAERARTLGHIKRLFHTVQALMRARSVHPLADLVALVVDAHRVANHQSATEVRQHARGGWAPLIYRHRALNIGSPGVLLLCC